MALTNDDLLSISQLLDVKLKAEIQPIKNEMQTLRNEIRSVKTELSYFQFLICRHTSILYRINPVRYPVISVIMADYQQKPAALHLTQRLNQILLCPVVQIAARLIQ